MAVRFASGADRLRRASNIVQGNTNYSAVFWARLIANVGATKFASYLSVQNAVQYAGVYGQTGFNDAKVAANNGGGESFTADKLLYVNRWTPLAYVRSGTTHKAYIYGAHVGDTIEDMSAITFTEIMLGNDGFSDAALEIMYFREWNTVLTLAELHAEWNATSAVKGANLWSDCPLLTNGNDVSGNNRHFTSIGAPVFFTGPSVIPETNISLETAYTIPSLPFRGVQVTGNVGDIPTPPHRYFKYTTLTTDNLLSFFAHTISGTNAGTLTGTNMNLVRGPLASPVTELIISSLNSPYQRVITPSVDYYFDFSYARDTFEPYSGEVRIEASPNNSASEGTIVINDDTEGFPLCLVSPAGSVLQFRNPFPAGEYGDCLRLNGRYLFQDLAASNLKFYENDLSTVSTITIPGFSTQVQPAIRAQQTLNRFYVGENKNTVPAQVVYVDSDGVVSGIIANLTNLNGRIQQLCANNDASILYYSCKNDSIIRRHNLNTDTAIADFTAALPGAQSIQEILVLTDGTIVALAVESLGAGVARPTTARRYNAAGTLLNTYSIGNNNTHSPPRATYALDDTSFWIYLHTADGITPAAVYDARFIEVRVSDGVFLTDFRIATFDAGGSNQRTANTILGMDTTLDMFGPSPSCPIIVSMLGTIPATSGGGGGGNGGGVIIPNVASGIYKIVPGKRNDTLWNENFDGTTDVKIPNPFSRFPLLGE